MVDNYDAQAAKATPGLGCGMNASLTATPPPAPPAVTPQEVRLYTALCLCHILRLNAPDTPYNDAQLQVQAGVLALTAGSCRDNAGTAAAVAPLLIPLLAFSA